jgi:subtilisin family serine protease
MVKALKLAVLASMFVMPALAYSKTITIAIIDTGVDKTLPNLCKMGHKSFAYRGRTLLSPTEDTNGHGTHIAGLVSSNAGFGDYCLVAIKYFSEYHTGYQNKRALLEAIQYAINIKVDFINISGGGPGWSSDEYSLIVDALNKGIKVVVAAGNEHTDLGDKNALDGASKAPNYHALPGPLSVIPDEPAPSKCDYFPACYDDRIVVVGNLQDNIDEVKRAPSSNYGSYIKRWEIGTEVLSTLPGGKFGRMTGTSQATAVATGKLVREALSR